MESLKKRSWIQIAIIYTRYLIGGAFVFASLVKIKGKRFTSESGAENAINTAWHFFETLYQSGLYWKFIGLGQLIAGALLMTQRYAKLGAVINFPIILNVFMITLSYYFAYTPVITGSMLLANIFLIIWDWNELQLIINRPPVLDHSIRLEKDISWTLTGIALFVFTCVNRIWTDSPQPFFWLGGCLIIGSIGLFAGLYRDWKRRKKEAVR